MSFQDVIGHGAIKKQIISSISLGKFSHAHILSGEDGIGKSVLANEIALKLLGKTEKRQYTDIVNIKVSKNKKSIGIDEIKNVIKEVNIKPYEGDKKVIIIYNADSITVEAQNAFLKTIEEPPKGIFIIMLCENLENILETIKSRCQIYKLNHLNENEMEHFLINNYPNLDKDSLNIISIASDYIPGRAQKFIEDDTFNNVRNISMEVLKSIVKGKYNLLEYTDELMKYKELWKEILTWFLSYIRDILIYKDTTSIDLIINMDKLDDIKYISEQTSIKKLNNIIEIIKDTSVKLESNVNTALVFDSMLLKMQEV